MSTTEILTEIRERLVRVETKLDAQADIRQVAESANKQAEQAKSSAKSAHMRIDKIDKIIFWAGTTIIGAGIVGVITFFMGG